jgi:hypothetical protein
MSQGWWLEEGEDEVRLKSPRVSVAVGRDAGAIVEIAARRRPFDFAGVIARRREAYHARVEEASHRREHAASAHSEGAPETIHGAISVKEPGLERLLVYDERPRSASQEWIRSEAEVDRAGGLGASIGRGPVGVTFALTPGSDRVRLRARDPRFESLEKEIAPGRDDREFEVSFRGVPAQAWLLTEWNLSLLTPDAPGRTLILEGLTPRTVAPGSTGHADGVTSVRLRDEEYLRVSLTLRFTPAARLEWSPVETVSLSEAGAERVYQGTAFLIGFRGPDVIRIHARVDEADNVL